MVKCAINYLFDFDPVIKIPKFEPDWTNLIFNISFFDALIQAKKQIYVNPLKKKIYSRWFCQFWSTWKKCLGWVDPPKTFTDYCWNLPTTHAYLMVLSDRLWHPNDIFKQYPDINKIFLFHSLGVHPDFRRNGIAKQLVTKGFEVCTDFIF